jgi:hypothetical protein
MLFSVTPSLSLGRVSPLCHRGWASECCCFNGLKLCVVAWFGLVFWLANNVLIIMLVDSWSIWLCSIFLVNRLCVLYSGIGPWSLSWLRYACSLYNCEAGFDLWYIGTNRYQWCEGDNINSLNLCLACWDFCDWVLVCADDWLAECVILAILLCCYLWLILNDGNTQGSNYEI